MLKKKKTISSLHTQFRLGSVIILTAITGTGITQAGAGLDGYGEVSHDSEAASVRVEGSSERLSNVTQAFRRIHDLLAKVPRPSEEEASAVRDEHNHLRAEQARLEEEFKILRSEDDESIPSIAELREQLLAAQEKRDELADEHLQVQASLKMEKEGKGLRREVVLGDLNAISMLLVKNRVVPFDVPYFAGKKCRIKMALSGEVVPGVSIKRVQDGQSATSAVKAGGLLTKLMKGKDPSKHYFMIEVCSDSIPAFHTVTEALAEAGFSYQWDTGKDEEILITEERLRSGNNKPSTKRGYAPEKS